jgi:RNA polymerase sigma-70 factor, ECF subfamily
MPRRDDEKLLIGLVRRGSRAAYERLFRKYWPAAWRAAHAVTLDRALADDVAQETMERLFASLDRFDDERPLAPWVKQIAVNRAIDELRRDRRLVRGEPDAGETGPAWSDEAREEDLALAKAVAALPPDSRLVVVLHYWLDYGAREIGELLGVPTGTVTSRLSRARNELRRAIAAEEEEDEDAA